MDEILRERVDAALTPTTVYRRLGGTALLEPKERGWTTPLVAADPAASFRYRRESGTDGLSELREWLVDVGVSLDPTDDGWRSETAAGAIGYLGYDLADEMESLPDDTVRDVDLPDIAFDLYDTVATFGEDAVVVEAVEHDRQRRPAAERVADFADRLRSGAGPPAGRVDATGGTSNFSREAYEQAVETVKRRVREGDTFQANVSQRIAFESDASPLSLYAALRETNPAPYMGLLEFDDHAVVSTSPELLLRKSGTDLRTRPIAGTRPRSDDSEEDEALRAELTASEKERAEHSILVDLVRNDLGMVSRHGSVTVDRFLETVPYAAVQHLESVVTGDLRADRDLVDAVRSVFPGGTVTGAPKPRTLAIIDEVEPTERGPYTGSMGRIGFDGDATLNILIRTVVSEGSRHYLQVGGGVVHDSDPASEYEETLQKAEAILDAVDLRDDPALSSPRDERPRRGDAPTGTAGAGVGETTDVTESGNRSRTVAEGGIATTDTGNSAAGGAGGAARSEASEDVKIAVVDNYDSFVGNLEQYLGEFADVTTRRYERVPDADGIVLSPGPGRPEEFPVMDDVLSSADVPVLGVCLGHQAIAEHFGGEVGYAGRVVHGKRSAVEHDGTGVFAGLPEPTPVARYHSLVVTEVPDDLAVVARGAGEVMGLAHPDRPVFGVQFHPESVLTPAGLDLVRNFVDVVRRERVRQGPDEAGAEPR